MKKLTSYLLSILACFLIFTITSQGQIVPTSSYSSELVFAEPPAKYYILGSNDIVSVDSLGNEAVVGKKLNKKFWSEGGFIIELNDTEYAIDSNGFIWSREGQFLSTVGNHLTKK